MPLAQKYPRLCAIAYEKNVSIEGVFEKGIDNMGFRRRLIGDKMVEWCRFETGCGGVSLSDEENKLIWTLIKDGRFTVKSFYRELKSQVIGYLFKFLSKVRIPLKIKVFLWLVLWKSIGVERGGDEANEGGKEKRNINYVGRRNQLSIFFPAPTS